MVKLYNGNSLDVLKTIESDSVDSIVCDPPYEINFMSSRWDNTGIAYNVELWKECLRVLKPGGHLLSFGGSRTYHRMAVAIEDAGFEIRDMIEYMYGSGFPKSHNIFKQLTKQCSCGFMEAYEKRTKQKTEHDMRFMSESDLSQEVNISKEQGEILQSSLSEQSSQIQQFESSKNVWREKSRMEGRNNVEKDTRELSGNNLCEVSERVYSDGTKRWIHNATQIDNGSTPEQAINKDRSSSSFRPQPSEQSDREPCSFCKQWRTQAIRTLGVGSQLKPAHEPVCMARKPLSEKTIAENCLRWGTGGINIDGCRVGTEIISQHGRNKNNNLGQVPQNEYHPNNSWQGRFPANLILSYPENEYILKPEITDEQKKKVLRWIYENA